jgi:hypothetical protein
MDWLFKKLFGETLPDDDVIRWIFATYEWFFLYHGGFDKFLRERSLIAPLNKNFPTTTHGDHNMAWEIFQQVKAYSGMKDWYCNLEVLREQPRRPREKWKGDSIDNEDGEAAGTFSMGWNNDNATITYAPDQLERPHSLVAVFAHELSHYFLANTPIDPPVGPKAEEPATDLCAVYLGFGIFMCNAVKEYGSGAVISRQGYLEEHTLAFALAIFTELHSQDANSTAKHLHTNPRSYYHSAVKDIHKRWAPEMRKLRQTNPR